MSSVSDFSAKMSRHVSQRFHSSVAPLTEANLYRHTITSPPSREAKLKHILGYVELQRELISLEEELLRNTDNGQWRSTQNDIKPTGTDIAVELSTSLPPPIPPHRRPLKKQPQQKEQGRPEDQTQRQERPEQPELAHRRLIPSTCKGTTEQRFSVPPVQQPHHEQCSSQNRSSRTAGSVPVGLDPVMALPRALPRAIPQQDSTFQRDSFYSGIDQENDWRQLEQLDPDSLAGIHIYSDSNDLHPHQQQSLQGQLSPAAPSSPINKFPTYEYSPKTARSAEWQQERHLQQLQQQSIFRQLQCPDDDDEIQVATRLQRQHALTLAQQQHQRVLSSTSPTPDDKTKKTSRFSSRFSFLTRRRQAQHQRHESVPTVLHERRSPTDRNVSPTRFNSLNHRTGGQVAAALAFEEGREYEHRPLRQEETPPLVNRKSSNRVKQMFKDVFGMSSSRNRNSRSPESAFRDISLPTTHIRTSTPQQYAYRPNHQQHLEPSIHSSVNHYSMAQQRKGLVTPVSRPDTAQSNYRQDRPSSRSGIGSKNPLRESLVDPLQQQQMILQKRLEMDGIYENNLSYYQDELSSILKSPFGQTSLTPPPASSVLRHSASSNRLFSNPIVGLDCEPKLISPAATTLDAQRPQPKTRRSSQLMPIPKDFVDSGCGSTGGNEPYATTSNATTLHHNQNGSVSQQNQSLSGHQGPHAKQEQPYQSLLSYEFESGMPKSRSYDNGPTLLSITQVQKVDLEGLRQSHRHHSASSPPLPTHSHHLGMVAVGAPYA